MYVSYLIHCMYERWKIYNDKEMDYIYSDDNQKILIEPQQKSTRKNIIDQYVRYRKKIGITQAELARRAECQNKYYTF